MVQVCIFYLASCHAMDVDANSYLGSPRPELGTSKSERVQVKITW